MGKTFYFVLIVACATALAGCNGEAAPQAVPDADLVGTLWTLQSIELPGEPDIQPEADKTFSIQFFEDGRIEGQIDCNTYSGEYTLYEGDSIQVNIQYITEVGCGDSDKSIEKRLLGDFRVVYSFGIIGNRLQLYFDNSVLNYLDME